MSSLTVNVRAFRINLRKKLVEEAEEPVAKEASINIYINNSHVVTLFASPNHLKELGIGWLLSQGIIESIEEIREIKVRAE